MANRINREAIYQALFDLVTADAGVKAIFGDRVGRLLPHITNVPDDACPALYTFQLPERRVNVGKGMSPKRTLVVAYIAYFSAAQMTTQFPATAINAAADAIDAAIIDPGTPDNTQTLGGLVEHVYIEPTVTPYEGLLQEKSALVAVIAMLVP